MKANGNNGVHEINTTKIKLNGLDKKKVSADSNVESNFHNNLHHIISKSNQNKNKNDAQANGNNNNLNYGLNTDNTLDYNNVSPQTIEKLKKIVNTADILEIQIINSLTLQRGLKIEINALGMISNSERKAYDGNTFFGFLGENDDDDININNNNEVDFVIKPRENNYENRILGRHFRIRFDLNNMGYFIKDLGCGYGTFKKITKTKIKDSYLINIGNSYIVCTFGVDEYDVNEKGIEDGDKMLNIKVFSEIPKTEPYFFNPQQIKRIYVGRDISCNIIVDDTLLSRIHCTIEYKNDEGWIIYDGKIDDDPSQNRPSTNGTCLYLIEETPINDKMIFKSNQNVYECHIIKQKTES